MAHWQIRRWGSGLVVVVLLLGFDAEPSQAGVTLDASRAFVVGATDFATHPEFGAPVLTTMPDPSFEDELGNGGSIFMTRVSISHLTTRGNGQTFLVNEDFKLGAVEFRLAGSEDATTDPNNDHIYSLHLFDLTNGTSLPGSYRPSTDAPGGDLLSDATFQYVTVPVTEDRMALFTFDVSDQVDLLAGHQYALEIWPNGDSTTVEQHAMFIIRTGGDGTYLDGNIYSADAAADAGNTVPYYAPANLRVQNSGADRDAPMALYAATDNPVGDDGDLNDDGFIDADDIDILWAVVRGGGPDPNDNDTEDLNGDSFVNEDDVDHMLANLLTAGTGRLYGDADLDGGVGGLDFTAWRLRVGTGWANGDFDGDGGIGGLDFTLWRTRPSVYPSEVGPHSGLAAVPEPGTLVLMGVGLPALALAVVRRRRCKQ